jgi:hypothetical protein
LKSPLVIAANKIEDSDEESPAVWKILRTLEERLVRSRDLTVSPTEATVVCNICDRSFSSIGDVLEHCWREH